MSLLLDSRDVGVVNFQDQAKKKDDVVVRGISCFFRSGFRGGGARGDAFVASAEESRDASRACQKETEKGQKPLGFRIGAESDSSESSSIGGCSNSTTGDAGGGDGEEDEVQSRFVSPLGDLGCLEESLPIKRGLSNFFAGKSKSFGCLTDANSVKDLAKTENPFNKRRRILLANKNVGPRRGSLGNLTAMSSQNLFSPASVLEEKEEEEEEDEDDEQRERGDVCTSPLPQGRKLKSFMSPRSFSLTDLHQV